MPSLKLADAWKDFTPPSPPDVSGKKEEKKEGGNTVHTDSEMFSVPDTGSKTVFEAAPSSAAGSPLSAKGRSSFFLSPDTEGVLEPGNIDLRRRPVVRNRDGSVSMARSFSIAKEGREYLIPTVSDEGRLLSDQEAISQFEKTGRHLGAFRTAQDAAEYADRMDRRQELLYAANPQEFQGVEIQQGSLVAGVPARLPGEAATPLSPVRPRSLFDRPLTNSPLISSPARTEAAYRPDPQRMEELHALILHDKNDPELEALLERNPAYRTQAALDDGSMPARALLGQQVLREVAGERYAKEPGFYFLALKEKLPEAATRQEAYAAVYDHYRKAVEKQYEENKSRKAAYQKNRAQVDEAVAHVVGGLWSPAELGVRLTPEQTDVYLKEFDTGAVEKAHAAFSLLKQAFSGTPEEGLRRMVSERTAMQITSALSDDDGAGKLTINETAFDLFEGSLRKLMGAVKEESGDEWKFMHNMCLALFNPVVKRDATLATGLQLSGQQNLLVPFAKGHNTQVFDLMEETVREYQSYIKNDRENARVLGLLSTGQDMGNQSNDSASFATRTVNCLGSVTGQTGSFFIPYVGWGIALAGAYDDKRNRAYYEGLEPGTAEWSAFVDAAASVAVEKISYGALGRLSGAGWVMGKLPFMGKARKALTDSLWKHVLFETGAGVVEETFVEPTAEAIIQWAVRNGIAPLAGVDVGGSYDWSNYWNELKGMMEPDQLLATALFVGGLAGGTTGANSLIMQRSLVVNSRSPEMLMTQGITEDEAKRISGITDNGERVAAVREAVNKLKTLPPEEVRQNAEEGVKAFRSLAEVRAAVESEAYKFFQQEMRLPLVEEKPDKPGTYNVTVFDVDSGQKKFTQEMAEEQLVSLFGNYFNEDKRTHIAEAQSAFAANAFLRTAEKGNVVQSQDMLQLGKTTGVGQGTGVEKTPEEGTEGNGRGGTGKVEESAAGKVENELASETDRPGSPAPATSARETREKADSSGPLEDDSTTPKDGPAGTENLSVLGKFIRTVGGMSQTGFSYLTRIALDEWNRRLSSGLSREQAAAAPFAPLSPYAPLRSFLGLEKAFHERLKIAAKTTGEEGAMQTNLFQMGTAPGTTPADILFLVSKGLVGTREMLEDLFEVGIKNLVKGDTARLEAMGGLLRETQAGLQKLGFRGQFISPTGPLNEMKVVEGMSKLALSDTLINAESLPLPRWQKDLLQYHVSYLNDASYLLNLGRAWNLGREKGTITKSMEDILRDLGHRVHTIFDQARIEQQDIQAVMEARAIVFGKGGPGSSAGGPTASQIRERQQRDEEEEKAHITTGDKSKERVVPREALQHPETVALPEAPESMQGVFANGASWNPDAGTWLGMVPVDKLHLSPEVPQVKVNSGKKGVVNPLVGDYRADAPPVYVWKRKNGKLEVVSGRHRLDLAQRTGIKAIPAYVYEEDSIHNARWARLLDYEQNMQDDQADELTAAIYVRETSLTDDELTRRGLTRSGTKSQRGLLIGREAREDLWTRFRSGAITAQNAEAICLLTQHIRDKARIDAMQTAAANDLARGKSLEFAAAKIQLMAHASADEGMVQGLISFGESFEQDMERAAEYVARCISVINEHINAIKGVRTISRKGNVLATEGITAGLSSDPAERLKELELLKAMYEKIGLYENLRVRALTWDGHSLPDPIGDHRLDMQAGRARAEEEASALEDEENRKAAEALTSEFSFSLSPSSFFSPSSRVESAFPFLWQQAEKELNGKGRVSFSLNGSRVAIYTFSERDIRKSLEMGGMVNMGGIGGPVNRREVIPFGSVPAGEIACILHPESLGQVSRMAANPETEGSGSLLSLSDFSGFIIPSSQEESLLPALLELGVPVRVYHVTGEEAAFLGDPRSMEREVVEKDGVENDGARRKRLEVRRNNVIRSFLEETDVSFSLSAAERRIATKAKREDTWMKAPDGTPTALTERQWLQVHSEAFREWFGESKIVNEHGEPVVVYHGTARADRVGTVFRGDRATSGPMAFFTDHENIAANYAKDKRDTSIGYEAEDYYDYHQQFRVVLPDGQDISLERYWNYLSLAEQRRIATLAGQIREDWDGDNSIIVDPAINDANGAFPYHLQEARGNAFRALVIQWLESAILFDEEHRFLDVLEKLDLPLSPYYRDPNYQEPKVYACYMRIENPFRTPRITKKIIASLKAASRKAMIDRESWRTDLWDKNSVSPEDWIERLENDYENKTTHAWASIPDWVTAWLRKKGYDGIIDQGGKFHAEEHTVCIPFDSGQIKSATDNRGTFDPGNADITFSLSNLAAVHSLDADKLAAADKLGGLPLPSLAVTRLDRPYTWGDDDNVYLVGSPDLADPARGVEIYDRDMWSGHFPELRWNRREEKEREEFYSKAQDAALRYYGGADVPPLRFLKNALDGDHRGALESKLRTNDLSLAVFAGERGYAPRPLMTKTPGRLNTGDRIFYSEIRKMRPDKHANVLAVERQEEFCAAMERAIERYRTQFAQDSQENKLTISQTLVRKGNLSEMEKELKEAREDNFDVISHLALIDASQFGKTVPDWSGNFRRFEKYAATHKKAFDAWVQDKMDRWLNPVPRIKENGFPATLENVTRYMLGSKGNGAEYKDSFFPTGLLRAKKSRRFHSLDQIKESRDILVTSDEYDASQEEAQGLIQKFQETLFGIVNDFSAYNKAVEALSLIEGEPTPSKVLSALSRLYRGASYRGRMARNSGNLLGLGAAALHAMKSELRDYYEAVPQRAVQLQEFSHAVMPASLRKNKQIRDILKRHGIRPLYHDGTLEGRTRVMTSLMGSAASFSLHSGRASGGTSEAAFSDSSRFRFPTSDFMGSLSEEERRLSKKALASGTWLKAPNGEHSRLTPRQWVQVRTAAFKNWFGDWETDPAHASRVVDENGEPRVVYHGTPVPYDPRYGWVDAVTYRHMPAPFSVFGEGNWHGAKFFFDDYNSARYFASDKALDMDIGDEAYTFECFLNARKLFVVTDKEAVSRVIDSFPDSVPVVHPQMGSVEHVSREAVAGLVNTSQSWILAETKEFQQKLQELGYDGFVAADRGDYYTAVFKSSQIKSATENVGSFDSSSPDITFSVIGPNAATWKRYQKNAFSGRDDGMQRAEIDASQAVLKDRSAPYLEPLRRELTAVRQSLSGETKKKIGRFLSLHWKFYRNKKGIEAEDHPDLWREYISLDREREEWSQLLTEALLRTGLYHSRPAGAAVQAQLTSSLEFLLREDEDEIRALAHRAADNTVMTLDEWLDYPELFAAYPKLRSMPVISRYLEKGILGLFSPAEWTIYIDRNTSDPQKIRSILLHEIQHSIQQIEGFAKGGMPETARQFYEFMRREAQEAYDQSSRFMSWLNARDSMISTLEYMLSLARNPSRVLRTSYLYSYDNVLRRLEGEECILDMTRYALEDMSGILEQFYQEDWNRDAKFDLPWPGDYALNTPAGIKECLEAARATPSRRLAYRRIPKPDLGALYRNLLKYEKLSGLSSHELYRHLAGEIESRHVEHRKDWTAERRAAEPFNDTLEFPEESLVSFSLGDGLSSSPEPHSLQGGSPLPGALPLQDISTLQGISQKVLKDASQDSLQNEYETEQSIHASSGPASFTERPLLSRSGEGNPGRGHSDEPAGRENPGAGEGRPTGNGQAGSALPDEEARRETDAAHSGQFDPAVGVLGVKAYSLSPHLAELASRNHFYTGDIVEIENSAKGAAHFRRCLEEAKSSQVPYGECVYTYDAEEYEHMRLFLLPSGKAGFALKDGDMVSVFSHKRHGHEGKPSYALVALAVQMGAIKGDCYGTILPDLYAQFGFRAVARDRFNMEFAPESMQEPGHMERWYSDQEGKPDVVYLVYRGNRARVVEEFDQEAESGFESLPYSNFDACLEIQSRAVEVQRDREAVASGLSLGRNDFFPSPDSTEAPVSFSLSPPERYKDGDGKIIRHWSLGEPSSDLLLKRKPLKEGEFCRVERVFRKSGSFEFSSRNKVESTADIAYIFRQLENASVENVFAVYIKDGQPIVQHISMGGIDSSIVEGGGIIAAMGRLKPEAFYLVHNHPSGSLNASPEDINTHRRLRRMFGDVVQEGIIIDTTSGYFAVFDSASPRKRSSSPMPGHPDKEQPVSLYAFDRAVFSPDWNPSKIARISGPKDIAAFISGHRLGERKKISLLIFNTQLQIVANIHTRYTSLSSPGLAKHIAECTAVYGGWHVAVYGDFTDQALSRAVSAQEGFSELKSRLQAFHESVNLVDAIQVHGNHYSSLVSSYSSHVVDGERDISSFSLTSIQKVVSSLTAPSLQATRAAELVKDCDKAAENWRRIMSGKAERPSARVGAELFGMVGAFLSAARYVLPEGYRSNVDMQMQWASVYAAMAESGEIPPKGTLRSGEAIYKKFEESMINNTTGAANAEEVRDILAAIGSQRLDRVMSKVLDRVRGQLIRYAKDELYLKTMKRVEVIYPKKEIGRKSPRGRLEAQAYRAVAGYREMLGATAEAKAESMETLEAKFNTEEDEEKRQEHEEDIIAWKTYGDYAGMSLPQAQTAMEKLLEFIMEGRNSWADKLRKEGGRTKYAARQIQKNLPVVNSASSRAGSKITHRTKLRKLLASLPYSFMSYAQLMLAMEPVLGQRFSRARIKEISDANAALLNASNDRSAWLFDTICRIAGVKSESAAEQWLVKFNTPEKTDIPIAPVIVLKVVLSIEEAREWLSLSREERDARRKEIREEDRRTETLTENVPEAEDILLLRQALDEYEKKSPEQQQYQKNVTSLREVPNEEASGILTCSRDCALYAILLHEQPDYADMFDKEGNMIRKGFLRREGLDDAGIGALYEFVGPDGLEYGYALRKRLQETGKTLAQVYEERMGVPFTFKENYFRATFDRNSTKEKDVLTEPKMGSIGGGKYGLLIDRIIHSENLDFSKAGTLVFLAAAAEQDNYIYTSHITTAWRGLLKNKTLEQKLKQNLGEDMMGKLSSWMDLIDGASLENNRAFLNLSRMQGILQKAFAVSVLAGNGYVLLKQSSAILHGFFSGWVPSAVLERADGTRELAHRHISFADYLFHLAASKMGLGDISLKAVMASPYFQARVRREGAMLAQIGNQMPGQRYSRMEKLPEKAMDLIEWVDVKANLLAMHALANAYYAKAKALNEANGSPFTDEQLRESALEQVGMSLELGAQPLTKTQKSMNQAAGGILSKLAFVMKSEQLNKLGMMAAEWKTGSARNRVCAAQSWLALGVTSSLLAWLITWIKGMDDDDDKEKKWKKYAASTLLGDLTTIPLAGEGVNYLSSLFTGEPIFADSYARTLINVQGAARTVKKEYEHLADKKEMDWDQHFNNLTSLARAAGVGGAFSRSPSAVVSSYGALSLAAATGANISRTSKDLLTTLFRDAEEDRKKKKKKHKRKKIRGK